MAPAQRPLLPLLLLLLPLRARNEDPARANADRYAVYWNRSNPRPTSPIVVYPCVVTSEVNKDGHAPSPRASGSCGSHHLGPQERCCQDHGVTGLFQGEDRGDQGLSVRERPRRALVRDGVSVCSLLLCHFQGGWFRDAPLPWPLRHPCWHRPEYESVMAPESCAWTRGYQHGKADAGLEPKRERQRGFQVSAVGDGGGYTVEVSINDYLDIYCPHYGAPLPPAERMERYILYMVNGEGHASCDHRQRGFKRWECNRPAAPGGPLKFSEKFQLFTPFSLGFEFRPGHEYYYISATPPNLVDRPCLRLKVYVRPTNETLYEAPEPIFTSNSSCSGLGGCHLFLTTVPVLWSLLGP